jgi:hypothetical protein
VSYSAAYVLPDRPPAEGDDIASTSGWFDWSNSVMARGAEFPAAAHLGAFGWSDQFADLETDLEQLLHVGDPPDLSAVTAQILAALRARPEGTTEFIVTDGEPGDEGDEGDEGE